MPKLIDYPRTNYTGAWELGEIVDDTGGKCAIDTAARKLNRKVSGSFKAIIGSAVKFGLMTSKRELLTTTTLFRRIKHAYDKAEELQFHREAFLTPPLFTQLCRKFRNRELPVQMLDVMLIREFGVEEINAQNVAKAFVDGCRMCGLLDERNIIADIDAINSNRIPRREIASPVPSVQSFEPNTPPKPEYLPEHPTPSTVQKTTPGVNSSEIELELFGQPAKPFLQTTRVPYQNASTGSDAVANLFGFVNPSENRADTNENSLAETIHQKITDILPGTGDSAQQTSSYNTTQAVPMPAINKALSLATGYQMQMSGPGVNTSLDITDEADIAIAIALLDKIRRQLRA